MTNKPNGQAENGEDGSLVRRDAKGRLLPGHPGLKKKGTPSKPRALLKIALDRIGNNEAFLDEDGNKVNYDTAILTKLASLAAAGDLQAIAIWMSYRFGRPVPMEPDKGDQEGMVRYLRRLEASTGKSSWNPADNAHDITGGIEEQVNGQADTEKDDPKKAG